MITPPPGQRNSFVRRNVDLANYYLHNKATDLKREFLKRSVKFSGAMLWNQFLNEAKLADSIPSFKKAYQKIELTE